MNWTGSVIAWLDAHAGAVQALATVVLVAVTFWYVRITRDISISARKQLLQATQVIEASRRESRRSFLAMTHRFLGEISSLPIPVNDGPIVRNTVAWADRELRDFETLARSVDDVEPEQVSKVVGSLKGLALTIRALQEVPVAHGKRFTSFEISLWQGNLETARDGLQRISDAIDGS